MANEIDECTGCPAAPNRREFLRDASVIAAGVLTSLGLAARPVGAMTTAWIEAQPRNARANGNTVSYAIPVSNSVNIDRGNDVVLARWNNAVYAFSLACPHQKTALRWIEADSRFQCPKHKSKYQPDGTFISGKATRGMDRFSITREGGNVVVDVSAMHRQDEDPAGWAAAIVKIANEK